MKKMHKSKAQRWVCNVQRTTASIAVAACFSTTVLANPTNPTVVHGTASFATAGNILNVTNGHNAIINWGSFSIGVNELTRFIQPSALSAVLNRVIGQDPSAILGALQSNGRVFLVNPNGIVFGAGSQINVAGLVASTLNLSNEDFLNNRLNFTDGVGAGNVMNQGSITGGSVYLVGKAVTNDGLITSPNGEVVLAAGNSVELVNPGTPNLRVEVVAPDNEAKNLGSITAETGRIGIYAGLINNSGTLNAGSAVAEGGKILLKSTKSTTLESSSVINANGTSGGEIIVLSDMTEGLVQVGGTLNAAGATANGGFVETSAARVKVDDSARVTTMGGAGAPAGKWLIDPYDYYISSAYGGDITGATLSANLDLGDVEIQSATGMNTGNGDVFVNDAVSWNSPFSLTLLAERNIDVNQPVNNAGAGGILMYAGWNGSPGPGYGVTAGVGVINLASDVQSAGPLLFHAGGNINASSASFISNGAGNIMFDSAGGSITLAGSQINGADVPGGNVTLKSALTGGMVDIQSGATVAGRDVYLIADNLNLEGTVTGAPFTTILPFTTSRGIELGGSPCEPSCNALSLSQAELDKVFGGGMIIGDGFGGSGDLTFVGNVAPTPSFLNIGGANVLQTGGIISAALNVHASGDVILTQPGNQIPSISTGSIVGGSIQIANAGDLAIAGTVQANGSVSLTSTSGAIIDGNTDGFDIVASQVMLSGVSGVGSVADPIETQTPLLSVSAGNEVGIINSGNLMLASLSFSGGTASIGTTGMMDFGSNISASGNLALLANAGMNVNQDISTSGVLLLNAGTGDLVVDNALVMGSSASLIGNNIILDNSAFAAGMNGVAANAAGNLEVRNSSQLGYGIGYGLTEVTTGGNVLVDRGLIVGDPDVLLKAGGVVNINGTLAQQGAIHAISPNSININFPNGSGGGFFVNGTENLVYDPVANTGFFVGNPPVPATLGTGLIITYGSGGNFVMPSTVEQVVSGTLITALNESTKLPGPEKDEDVFDDARNNKDKDAPVCR